MKTPVGSWGGLGRDVRPKAVVAWVSETRVAIILAFGVVALVAQYLADRSYWLDEASLAANIERTAFAGLLGPMANNQLAPPGFLAVEWAVALVLGKTRLALRVVPLAGGVASLYLFHRVALRCVRPRSVWVAVGLFAVSDDLIYFASELKQYSTDVTAVLVCTLLGTAAASRPATPGRSAGLALAGASAVWFSHPSAFVLAGVGTVLLASSVASGSWRSALLRALTCLAWAASFAAVYAVSRTQLGPRRDMWAFWDFAFPPSHPSTLWDASWLIRRVSYLFVNPLNFETPLGPSLSVLPAQGFFLAGCVSLWRRDRAVFGMLTLPALFALSASYLRLYPFHGRLVLFLVPALLLLVAEGAGWSREAVGPGLLGSAVLATLLLFPGLGVLYHLAEPRDRKDFNRHGDRRPGRLDPGWFPFRPTPHNPAFDPPRPE